MLIQTKRNKPWARPSAARREPRSKEEASQWFLRWYQALPTRFHEGLDHSQRSKLNGSPTEKRRSK
jgi:hypothetical protein